MTTQLFRTALLLAVTIPVIGKAAERPNIVIILADDLGWADVSYHGGYIKTPNLDQLAREGVELDRFYVCPMCSPTRATLLTGRYPVRFGLSRAVIPPWRNYGLSTDEVTLADVLKKAGYRNRGVFGKWHLGHQQAKWHPLARGFTHFHGHYNGAIDYFTHLREGERDWHINYRPSAERGYSTDLIADAACRFIKDSADEGPFFCYVPFNAPHSPLQSREDYKKRYSDLPPSRGPGSQKKAPKAAAKLADDRRTLAGMISCMDDGIGRILKAIDQAGIRDNTLVWFFSDNGGIGKIPDNNLPLRGNKLDVFEGGIRVPALIRWPGKLTGKRKVTAPLGCVDVLPTLMRYAGISKHGGKPLDGHDVSKVLVGEQQTLARELFFYHGQAGPENEEVALITPEWKLIVLGPDVRRDSDAGQETYLFRIEEDPLEKMNLANKRPEVVSRLKKRLVELRSLQPADAVPIYAGGKDGFKAPKNWEVKAPAP